MAQASDGSSPHVTLVRYPRPDTEGAPWSHWGQGMVTDDGRFVSAIGNHLGEDGNSFVFVFDPDDGVLTRFADVVESADAPSVPSWGFGKVHAQIVPGDCHEAFVATYWGTRRGLTYSDSYRGDMLFRLDTAALQLEPVTVPVPERGIPSLASSPEQGVVFAEAVDPLADTGPDQGAFAVIAMDTGETMVRDDTTEHVGFRSVLVDADGVAYVAAPEGRLLVYEPGSDALRTHPHELPGGGFLRAAAPPSSDGSTYLITRQPEHLAALRSDGTIDDLGPVAAYTTSVAAEPDGSQVYYVPGAHGGAPELGAPLVAASTETGATSTLARLDDLTQSALGLYVSGSYSVVRDPQEPRLYVMLNAGPDEDDRWGEVVLAVVDLPRTGSVLTPPAQPAASPVCLSSDAGVATTYEAVTTGDPQTPELGDVTEEWGLVEPLTGMRGHAIATGDVNGDGWIDLVVGTFADRPEDEYRRRGASGPAPDRLLLGGPDGFVLDEAFPDELGRTSGAALADLDSDGDLDLVLARNVRDSDRGRAPTRILRNDDGAFTPVSVLPEPRGARSVGVLDYDADGMLDVVITEDRFSGGSSRLLRNGGDFAFSDVTEEAGLPEDVHGLGVAAADLTGDGYPEILVGGSNRLFVHQGDGTFSEQPDAIAAWPVHGDEDDPAGVAVGDVDGDGRPDVVIGQHYNSTVDDDRRVPVRLYLNRPGRSSEEDLHLVDVTQAAGLTPLATKSPHVQLADVDADGRLDVVTSASTGDGAPVVFLQHDRDGDVPRFAASGPSETDQYWVTGAVADVDRDGRLDVVGVEWEPSLPTRAWTNRSATGHWLAVAAPAGTAVSVADGDELIASGQVAASSGYAAGPDPMLWLGLGSLTSVDLTVTRPQGGRSTVRGLDTDQSLVVCPDR